MNRVGDVRWMRVREASPGQVHAFSCRSSGEGATDPRAGDLRFGPTRSDGQVQKAWAHFLSALGLAALPVVGLEQVHGTTIHRVTRHPASSGLHRIGTGDGLWTDLPNLLLAVSTADCVPVLLFQPGEHPWCAAIHAGWRGLTAGVLGECLDQVESAGLFRPETCVAFVGPAVGPCCYEVGSDVLEGLASILPRRIDAVVRKVPGGGTHVDLPRAAAFALEDRGLLPEAIRDMSRCTSCSDEHFWSHRRDGLDRGGMASLIMLLESAHGS